ncbi:MAG: thrombospondin type 3 repeat-containing protein [Nanoarchaeota archaeon]|mgnify:CR=1 FL=1
MEYKSRLKNFIIIAILILNFAMVSAFEANEYPYFKKISILPSIDEPAIVKLDYQILNYMQSDGSDLRVTENLNEIPIKTIINPVEELAHKSKMISATSTRPNFRGISYAVNNIIDGDYTNNDNAYFQIDSVKDPIYAYFVVELPETILTDKAKIWSLNSDYTWTDIQIEGSNDNSNWDIIKSKTKYDIADVRTVAYPPVEYKYLKFSLWHTQSLVVNEIEIYGAYTGQVIFYAKSGNEYKLYYGNKKATKPSYDTSQLFTKKTTPILALGIQQSNTNFNVDNDGDGIVSDNCPTISNPDQTDSDGDGIGNACDDCTTQANSDQMDTDNDGIGDACDNCPSRFNSDQYDDNLNGKGYMCDDNDNDGVINPFDNCVSAPNPSQSDKDRNGIGDACEDIDNDGISFSKDNCINTYNPEQKDSDNDKIGDACDNCVAGYNPTQFDKNNNGIGDACDDDDGDNIKNYMDNCPKLANSNQKDSDSDSLGDACDNCPLIKNLEQSDEEDNGIGDVCDDSDKDGIINPRDNCPNVKNPEQKDQNNNGIGDDCEDFDNDGVMNYEDNCLYDYNPRAYAGNERRQSDIDKDGKGDACDKEDDRITEKKGLIWPVIIITILIVGFLAWQLSKKPINQK